MIANILEHLGLWITHVISSLGYLGVVLLMAIESACIPLPSEIIMPFAGAVTVASIAAAQNPPIAPLNLWLVALTGAIGCNVGSVVAYFVGTSQFLGRGPLQDVSGHAKLQQLTQICAILVHRQDQHAALRTGGQ